MNKRSQSRKHCALAVV